MRSFLVFLFVLFLSNFVYALGFSSGDQFLSEPIYGTVHVVCDTPNPVTFQCRDIIFMPTSLDYFVGPSVDADEVELIASHENGELVRKATGYRNGTSTMRFNLSNVSLFQSPLLASGRNTIQFSLKKLGQIVQQGTFVVNVKQGQTRNCRTSTITSPDSNLCNSPYSACQRYFIEQNYCK
jgi:hypothetical protein